MILPGKGVALAGPEAGYTRVAGSYMTWVPGVSEKLPPRIASGATLAFASDWNVAEMEPVVGIYTALTRKGLDGKPDGGWIPQQTIDLETAIRGYTINGAYANFAEQNRGSITPGKYADLILLSDNLFEIPTDKIKDDKVVWTMVGGKEVWKAY